MSARRRPIMRGCTVEHINGRRGVVIDLVEVNGLPGAIVDFEPKDRRQPHTRERLPLGFVCWVGYGVET